MVVVVGTALGRFAVDGSTTSLGELDGRDVTAIAAGGWALADGTDLFLGDREIAKLDGLAGQCLLPTADGVLVGTSEARVLAVDGTGAVQPLESFDAIATRDEWYTPWGAPPDTRSLSGGGEGPLLVNVHVGGVWRCLPDSSIWEPVVDVDTDTHQVAIDGDLAVAAAAVGFGCSGDGGRSWTWTDAGLHASYCRGVARSGDTVLVSASTGPRTDRAAIYRRELGGDRFERCRVGLPEWFTANIDTFCLAGRDGVAAFGTVNGEVYLSSDEGRTWEQAASGLPPVRAVLVEPS